MDELWERFIATGAVSDYISYITFKQSGEENTDDAKGSGASRTEYRRER